jgi:hypothetical protein
MVVALFSACGTPEIVGVHQSVSVAQGEPTVSTSQGTVEHRQPLSPGDYGETNPFQVDTFSQTSTAKVDVLWVIDNSGSMAPKQSKVQADFQSFITKLTQPTANAEIVDYHIGVVTTDTYDPTESGKLQNPGHLSHPWIGNMDTCQTPCDPVAAFSTLANVGTLGTGDEKGMLAAEMALTAPLVNTANAGFLRPDASLAIIMVSDEDDSSCAPLMQLIGPYASSQTYQPNEVVSEDSGSYVALKTTTVDPATDVSNHGGHWQFTPIVKGCVDPLIDADSSGYGSTAYYARFFRELKGFGNESHVSFSAFVGDTQAVTVPDSTDMAGYLKGCLVSGADPTNPFSYATYASRYITVANEVAGLSATYAPDTSGSPVHSICSADFSAANSSIALYATLEDTFYLSREPSDPTMVQACVSSTEATPDAGTSCVDCAETGTSGAATASCTYDPTNNSVTFANVPAAGATITISYHADSN